MLKDTIESGQIFRWQPHEGGYLVSHAGEHFWVREEGKLYHQGTSKKFINEFFNLKEDHQKIKKELAKDPKLRPALEAHDLRILKQDPWECMIAFVCSQNSNITRIRKNMEDIARQGEGFPRPGEINVKKLKTKLGYREKYIQQINKQVTEEWLKKLKSVKYEEAKEELMTLPGIGPKVADCICLFSLGHGEAFPTDIWMQRAMKELYNIQPKQIHEFKKRWGRHAGIVQQYLYHWRRNL